MATKKPSGKAKPAGFPFGPSGGSEMTTVNSKGHNMKMMMKKLKLSKSIQKQFNKLGSK